MSSSPTPPQTPTQRKTFYTLLGVPSTSSRHSSPSSSSPYPQEKFDREHLWVTSPLFRNPFVFGGLRILVALYLFGTCIAFLVDYVKDGNGDNYLSFFTNLCYIGMTAYFFASGVQTLSYAVRWRRNGAGAGYALQSWPRPLQALHVALYSTIVTFPFIVTAVYWALIGGPEVFTNSKRAWQGTSVHILNSLLACSELVFSNSPPPPWMALPITILCLAAYLGVAYITYAAQGFYTYAFLNPSETGALLAAYICGILVAQIILFTLVHFIARLRHRICLKYRRVISFDKYPPSSPTSSGGRGSRERITRGDAEKGEAMEETRESAAYGVAYGGDERDDDDDDELGGGWEDVSHPNVSRPEGVGSVEVRAR
ncbi:hypothetical protein BKA70DRAFT_1107449 [Coprinopsis sp. MPI-PUGE-AT-0042]|nr:hypothetical protein BKA70DRAFT_1107449 [Coprinopsis sp. MPI-PUGE-AT-0042]